jgi:sterol desaturase/sphingolipid hydroxylase (fatty acid hydroxylase superfamily)
MGQALTSLGSFVDYWTFLNLSIELGFRTVIVSLREFLPTLFSTEAAGLWIVGFLCLWEQIRPWRPEQRRLRDGFSLDLFYTLANFLLFYQLIGTPLFQTIELAFRQALHDALGIDLGVAVSLGALHPWLQYLVLFLLVDLIGYLGHIMLHRIDLLWTFHRVHHSALELDTLNAVRQHWVEKLFYDLLAYVPLTLIGFDVEQTALALLLSMLFCTFTHSNLKVPLGPLKYVFNNPQLHLWHHAREVPHNRNVNYGSALSMWDYLFRTNYLPDDRNDIELGFEGVEDFPTTLLRQQFHPLDRWLPKPTGWGRALGRAAASALTAAAVVLVILGEALPDGVLALTRVNYRERAAQQLAQQQPGVALATIESSALIDPLRWTALQRLLAESREADWPAPSVRRFLTIGRGSANLRFRVGSAWLAQLDGLAPLDERQREELQLALANAEFLVQLEPGRPRAHHLLGTTRRASAAQGGGPEELQRAIVEFRRTLALDAHYPGARDALKEARALRDDAAAD